MTGPRVTGRVGGRSGLGDPRQAIRDLRSAAVNVPHFKVDEHAAQQPSPRQASP